MKLASRILGLALVVFAMAHGQSSAQVPTGKPEALFPEDIHAKAGLTCESCHGKPPANGTYAAFKRTDIAPMCAHCHSDAAYMQRFKRDVHVDQYARYKTSTHGKEMAKGETRVATCSDCHGAHGVRTVQDGASPVNPLHVVATCSRCHSDEARMKALKHNTKPPAEWKASVHAKALADGDTSAPTCATCHSGHGPTPTGVASLELVCSQCHVRETDLYNASPKKALFAELGHPGCITCHENHKILLPSDNWVSMKDPAAPCTTCHDPTVKGAAEIVTVRQELQKLTDGIDRAGVVLDRAERAGMLVDDGRVALRDARERQILARLNVHAFAMKPFTPIAAQGLTAASRAERSGYDALAELQFRRKGLAVATAVILGFLATLWWKIRRLPPIER
jgi:cytochrome c553